MAAEVTSVNSLSAEIGGCIMISLRPMPVTVICSMSLRDSFACAKASLKTFSAEARWSKPPKPMLLAIILLSFISTVFMVLAPISMPAVIIGHPPHAKYLLPESKNIYNINLVVQENSDIIII